MGNNISSVSSLPPSSLLSSPLAVLHAKRIDTNGAELGQTLEEVKMDYFTRPFNATFRSEGENLVYKDSYLRDLTDANVQHANLFTDAAVAAQGNYGPVILLDTITAAITRDLAKNDSIPKDVIFYFGHTIAILITASLCNGAFGQVKFHFAKLAGETSQDTIAFNDQDVKWECDLVPTANGCRAHISTECSSYKLGQQTVTSDKTRGPVLLIQETYSCELLAGDTSGTDQYEMVLKTDCTGLTSADAAILSKLQQERPTLLRRTVDFLLRTFAGGKSVLMWTSATPPGGTRMPMPASDPTPGQLPSSMTWVKTLGARDLANFQRRFTENDANVYATRVDSIRHQIHSIGTGQELKKLRHETVDLRRKLDALAKPNSLPQNANGKARSKTI